MVRAMAARRRPLGAARGTNQFRTEPAVGHEHAVTGLVRSGRFAWTSSTPEVRARESRDSNLPGRDVIPCGPLAVGFDDGPDDPDASDPAALLCEVDLRTAPAHEARVAEIARQAGLCVKTQFPVVAGSWRKSQRIDVVAWRPGRPDRLLALSCKMQHAEGTTCEKLDGEAHKLLVAQRHEPRIVTVCFSFLGHGWPLDPVEYVTVQLPTVMPQTARFRAVRGLRACRDFVTDWC